MRTLLLFFIFLSQAAIQMKAEVVDEQFKPLKIGVCERNFVDSSRSNWLGNGYRPVRSSIWYPAGQGGAAEIINDSSQFTKPITIFKDAKISRLKNKYPLILISHGAEGNVNQMRWLGYYLASRGYICVAVNHNGTDEEERKTGALSLTDFCMWERPKDISSVLSKILQDPVFSNKVDTERIGCAGFSLGGATAIWVAGANLSNDELAKNSSEPSPYIKASVDRFTELAKTDPIIINSNSHSEDSFKDSRIKAVFALAPAIGQGFTIESLKNIKVPVQIVAGDKDIIAPMELNAKHLSKNITMARPLIVLPGERGHYLTPSVGIKRALEFREVSQLAYHFFEEVL
jgi:predicted dienelactone hydrolase